MVPSNDRRTITSWLSCWWSETQHITWILLLSGNQSGKIIIILISVTSSIGTMTQVPADFEIMPFFGVWTSEASWRGSARNEIRGEDCSGSKEVIDLKGGRTVFIRKWFGERTIRFIFLQDFSGKKKIYLRKDSHLPSQQLWKFVVIQYKHQFILQTQSQQIKFSLEAKAI